MEIWNSVKIRNSKSKSEIQKWSKQKREKIRKIFKTSV